MFITQRALPRRTFLRAAGVTVALPLLDAMVPALSAKSAAPPPRLGFVYVSNGVIQNQWNPTSASSVPGSSVPGSSVPGSSVPGSSVPGSSVPGSSVPGSSAFDLPPILKPLEPVREYINVLTGLAHLQADTFGDGTGDHPRASAVWLTGVHAWDRTRPGVEVRLATTADQYAAREIGRGTQVPSLELNLDSPTQGACDSGDCFYVNTVSWRNETTPNVAESHPRLVFDRLFGDGGNAAQRLALAHDTGSILDSVTNEVNRLAGTLGRGDKTKLNEYLDSVREIEQRIQSTEARGAQSIELPDRPIDIPETFDAHAKLMFDLQALAFRADATRVFTLIMSRELSSRTYANIGVPDQHHAVSHHRNDPELIAKKAKIDTYHVQLLTYFLEKLKATPDGDGNLLDHSLILYGGGMGDGNLHRHTGLPCLLAGKLGGQFQTGRHLDYPENTPMANLLLTILDKAGVHVDKLGDSTGPLQPDYLSV